MAAGTVVSAWKDAANAYAAVTVDEGPPRGVVEYQVSTPLKDGAGAAKAGPQLKAELLAAVAALRTAQNAAVSPLAGMAGAVVV